MSAILTRPRTLVIAGLVLMLVGALDPLEGSLLILPGSAVATLGAFLGHGRHRALQAWACGLIVAGVGLLFFLSSLGGVGGNSGRSMWWILVLLPYPLGWVLGLTAAVLMLRSAPAGPSTRP